MVESSWLPPDVGTAVLRGGEMGRRFGAFDWASHPLGPLEGWPVATRSMVAAALTSRFPIVLWLGEPLFLVYNDAYVPMLGEKHPAALGCPGHEVWWDIWPVIEPMLAGVAESGVATWSDDLMLPLVSAGRRVERYFTFTYSPLIETDGQVGGVFCAVTETTERVLSERRLQALNALGAALMDTQIVDDVVGMTLKVCGEHQQDLPFVALYLEQSTHRDSALTGATASVAPLLAKWAPRLSSWRSAGASGSDDGVVGGILDRLPTLASIFGEGCPEQAVVLPLTDGRPASVAGSLVIGLSDRRPFDAQYRGFCRLIADQVAAALDNARAYEHERRRAELLAELDQAKTVFLANVSHEFRTPLTLMLGPLEDAILTAQTDDETRERLKMVQRNGHRLSRLVNSLLDFSRLESGRADPRLVTTDVGTLTAQIASAFSEVCQTAGIDLVVDCRPVMGTVDVYMWETIVLNLVSNAFKFTREGSITVRVTPGEQGGATVSVADTGSGIAAEEMPRLFERFHRVGDASGRSSEGTGIGLALVRSLVQLHKGTVKLSSEVGVGTVAIVDLPAATLDVAAVPPAELARTDSATPFVAEAAQWSGTDPTPPSSGSYLGSERPLILVVDDNADMRGHLSRILGERWRSVAVSDGQEALEFARRNRPDLIVTDVMMPTLDGFGLVGAIRDDPDLSALPLIMLSARAGEDSSGEGLAAGADDYLVKPFRSAELISRVSARLAVAARDRSDRERQDFLTARALATAELGANLNDVTALDDLPEVLLGSADGSLDATAVAIGVLNNASQTVRLLFAGDLPADLPDRYHLVALDAPVPIAEVVRRGRTMAIPDTRRLDQRFATMVADSLPTARSALIEPLRQGDGAVIGAVALSWPEPRQMGPDDLEMMDQVATMLSSAVDRILLTEREHRMVVGLQERLLDLDVRSTSSVVCALYEAASHATRIGGDWYTAATLDGGLTGVSVGDIVGHGLSAAAVMSQLRSALGAAALTTDDPKVVIDILDRYADGVAGSASSTVAYAIVDSSNQTVTYACAGHPYPLLIERDGTAAYLRDGRRGPLGTKRVTDGEGKGRSPMPAGSVLVLYTDGLIERPGETIDAGFDRLASAAAECWRLPTSEICAALLKGMTPEGGYPDDVAIVAVRPVGCTPTSLVAGAPASVDSIAVLRGQLRAWLNERHLDGDFINDVLVAVGEAVSNAIQHGSQMNPQLTVSLEAFLFGQGLSVTVTDSGRWAGDSSASRRDSNRGRGLAFIHALSTEVKVQRSSLGTRITMLFDVS